MTEHETPTHPRGLSRRLTMMLTMTLALIAAGCAGAAEPGAVVPGAADPSPGPEAEPGPDNAPPRSPAPEAAPAPEPPAPTSTVSDLVAGWLAEESCEDRLARGEAAAATVLEDWHDTQPYRREDVGYDVLDDIHDALNAHTVMGCPIGPLVAEVAARFEILEAEAERRVDAFAEGEAEAAAEAADRLPPIADLDPDRPGGALSADPEPDSNPDRPGCQTADNPVACFPPPADPDPGPEPDPDPEVDLDPETPRSVVEFEDTTADVEAQAQTTRRHPDGPVDRPALVGLWTMPDLLCPPEDEWRARYTTCGNPFADDDLLRPHTETRKCWFAPVELGVGDSYRVSYEGATVEGSPDITYYRDASVLEVLGFSAPEPAAGLWSWVAPKLRTERQVRVEYRDAEPYENTSSGVGAPPHDWMLIGGPDNRGLNPDGTLAWGLFALPSGAESC